MWFRASQEKEADQEGPMTSYTYCQEAKSDKDREVTLDLATWRSLAIIARSVLVTGRAELGKGPVSVTGGSQMGLSNEGVWYRLILS